MANQMSIMLLNVKFSQEFNALFPHRVVVQQLVKDHRAPVADPLDVSSFHPSHRIFGITTKVT